MNNLDKQYTDLLQDILDNGVTKQDRTGTGTLSVFGRTIRHSFKDGRFPLLTTKRIPFKLVVTELLWFLRGDTNIKYLVDNNCHIWDGDCYQAYLKKYKEDKTPGIVYYTDPLQYRPYPQEEFINKIKTDDEFAKKWGELGKIYGAQWRSWKGSNGMIGEEDEDGIKMINWNKIDQIQNLINDLKTNPDSRRLMVNAWAVHDLPNMVLPPCHYGFQVYTRELSLEERLTWMKNNKTNVVLPARDLNVEFSIDEFFRPYGVPTRAISLMYNARSQDVPLGTPFNISSYALLLEIIGKMVNMIPDELIANMGDCHIYLNQIDGVKEQIGRELTLEERKKLYENEFTPGMEVENDEWLESKLTTRNIPVRTREPYSLPTLKHMKTDDFYKSLSEDLSLLTHLDNTDFIIENYKSHPTIKIPLSN